MILVEAQAPTFTLSSVMNLSTSSTKEKGMYARVLHREDKMSYTRKLNIFSQDAFEIDCQSLLPLLRHSPIFKASCTLALLSEFRVHNFPADLATVCRERYPHKGVQNRLQCLSDSASDPSLSPIRNAPKDAHARALTICKNVRVECKQGDLSLLNVLVCNVQEWYHVPCCDCCVVLKFGSTDQASSLPLRYFGRAHLAFAQEVDIRESCLVRLNCALKLFMGSLCAHFKFSNPALQYVG